MHKAVNRQVVWALQGNVAQLACSSAVGCVDVSHPDLGLHNLFVDNVEFSPSLLRLYRADSDIDGWPLPVAEAYTRQDDLVAGYLAVDFWPYSPQVYWHANALSTVAGVVASVTLQVSVQTHLLYTLPRICVSSRVTDAEHFRMSFDKSGEVMALPIEFSTSIASETDDCCVITRPRNTRFSYIEIMAGGDFHSTALLKAADECTVEWRLFAEFLEKGVIRRARIHSAIVKRENDFEIAADCCREIGRLKLPLTT